MIAALTMLWLLSTIAAVVFAALIPASWIRVWKVSDAANGATNIIAALLLGGLAGFASLVTLTATTHVAVAFRQPYPLLVTVCTVLLFLALLAATLSGFATARREREGVIAPSRLLIRLGMALLVAGIICAALPRISSAFPWNSLMGATTAGLGVLIFAFERRRARAV